MASWRIWQALKWRWKFRRYLKEENRYRDFETKKILYRGAAYCLNCRDPVLNFGTLCAECDVQDRKLPSI